ncbi:hypothetical protein DP120_09140 [Planococcus halotolerans]|uniref:Uncharacterized protein n=1 Tax=Planococcus halotolerans TaxID=2233542 RepID=A0A365KXT7_9BACL|nr:hypothetical protein DP120_09140 [Planococcus halotolerans]
MSYKWILLTYRFVLLSYKSFIVTDSRFQLIFIQKNAKKEAEGIGLKQLAHASCLGRRAARSKQFLVCCLMVFVFYLTIFHFYLTIS